VTTEQQWEILLHRRVERVLRRLPQQLLQRIDRHIRSLAQDPRPPGCKKLVGYDNLYRVRVGDWRISYAIEEDQRVVLVVEVEHRSRAYRPRK